MDIFKNHLQYIENCKIYLNGSSERSQCSNRVAAELVRLGQKAIHTAEGFVVGGRGTARIYRKLKKIPKRRKTERESTKWKYSPPLEVQIKSGFLVKITGRKGKGKSQLANSLKIRTRSGSWVMTDVVSGKARGGGQLKKLLQYVVNRAKKEGSVEYVSFLAKAEKKRWAPNQKELEGIYWRSFSPIVSKHNIKTQRVGKFLRFTIKIK